MEIEIRRAVEADVPEIARIYNHAILNTTATFDMEPKSLEDRIEWFHHHSDIYPLLVAVVSGKVVGWGSIHPFGERKAYQYTVENAVYVDCDYHGQGIGSRLLQALVESAEQIGHHAIIALVVAGNDVSVRLHEKLGFERTGVMKEVGRKFDRWLDLIVLEKILRGNPQ